MHNSSSSEYAISLILINHFFSTCVADDVCVRLLSQLWYCSQLIMRQSIWFAATSWWKFFLFVSRHFLALNCQDLVLKVIYSIKLKHLKLLLEIVLFLKNNLHGLFPPLFACDIPRQCPFWKIKFLS